MTSAVRKALETAVAADDAAGAQLIGMVVYDYLTDQAQELDADLTALYAGWALDRVGVAKRHIGRSYVEKAAHGEYPDDSVQRYAQWLAGLESYVVDAVVSKDSYEQWANGINRLVRRNEKGQFARDLSSASPRNVTERKKTAPKRLAPSVQAYFTGDDLSEGADEVRLAYHQGQWERAGDLMDELSQAFRGTDRSKVNGVITLRTPNGRIDEIQFPLSAMNGSQLPREVGEKWQSIDDALTVSVEADRNAPKDVEARVAAFNTLGTIGGTALQRLVEVEPTRWKEFAAAAEMPTDPDESRLSRFFNQLSAGGRVLSQISGQERMGEWAQFVGTMGPQAEQVLGPYVQRAAYRYRGTEKTPDANLARELSPRQNEAIGQLADSPEALLSGDIGASFDSARVPAVMRRRAQDGLRGDSLAMQTRADIAGSYLARTLPRDPIIRRLSSASGNVLPSQGVLFDAEGNIVSQAVGYADDHYLPFDLKGLSKLRGGQYVRTRTQGGPTAEDMYAAIQTGARMFSVVSPSGVYTVEFEPTFRGARANSDKARQIYDRYVKILDAVKRSNLYLQDITPEDRDAIKQETIRRFKSLKADGADVFLQQRVNEKRQERMALAPEQIASLQQDTLREMGVEVAPEKLRGAERRQYEDIYSDKLDEARAQNARELKLNGEGYAVALATLQQQFPYFMKTPRYEAFSEFKQIVGLRRGDAAAGSPNAVDEGYVQPGALRPSTGIRTDDRTPEPAAPTAPSTTTPDAPSAPTGGVPDASSDAGAPKPPRERAQGSPGGLLARLQANTPILERQRNTKAAELVSGIGAIGDEYKDSAQSLAQMNFEEASLDPDTLARWFLTRDSNEVRGLLAASADNQTDALLPVLQDRQVMENAFRSIFAGAQLGGEDFFEDGGSVRGNRSIEDAAGWVADTSRDLANYMFAADPFEPVKNTQAEQEQYTGTKPQAFPEFADIRSRQDYETQISSDSDLAERMLTIAETEDGEELSMAGIGKKVAQRVDVLNRLEAAIPELRAGNPDALAAQGLTVRDVADAANVTAGEAESWALAADLSAERMKNQRAWSALIAGRVLQYLPAETGGEVNPKAWSPLPRQGVGKSDLNLPELMKALRIRHALIPVDLAGGVPAR